MCKSGRICRRKCRCCICFPRAGRAFNEDDRGRRCAERKRPIHRQVAIAGENSSFTWKLTSAHLSGAAVHAGIYFRKAAKASDLALLLCNYCRPSAQGYYHGSYVAGRRFVRAILGGHAFVVIQTKRNPRGEIRGAIKKTR